MLKLRIWNIDVDEVQSLHFGLGQLASSVRIASISTVYACCLVLIVQFFKPMLRAISIQIPIYTEVDTPAQISKAYRAKTSYDFLEEADCSWPPSADFICHWKNPEMMPLEELKEACGIMTACHAEAGKLEFELTGAPAFNNASRSTAKSKHRDDCWDWPGFQRVKKLLASRPITASKEFQGSKKAARKGKLALAISPILLISFSSCPANMHWLLSLLCCICLELFKLHLSHNLSTMYCSLWEIWMLLHTSHTSSLFVRLGPIMTFAASAVGLINADSFCNTVFIFTYRGDNRKGQIFRVLHSLWVAATATEIAWQTCLGILEADSFICEGAGGKKKWPECSELRSANAFHLTKLWGGLNPRRT